MLKKILRSPLFNILLLILLGLALLKEYFPTEAPIHLQLPPWVLLIPILVLLLLIPLHNVRSPKDKIKPTLLPMEFLEEDEGLKWITLKATRKVYIFYVFAIPVSMLLIALFQHLTYFPILLLAGIGAVQYAIYWQEVRKIG
ncbi:hypothetical protein ACLM5H_18550 [Fredinandcohnia humi]